MKKGLKILIPTVLASLFLLTTTAFAASANSTAKTNLMEALHTKNPLATTARIGWVTSYQPGVSITIRTREGEITFDLSKLTRVLPASSSSNLAVDSRVLVFATRDRGVRALSAYEIVDLRSGAAAAASAPTAAPSPAPSPAPAK